jgi:diadenosine tetraphosphate (Ap4A) HIT family hydrolase
VITDINQATSVKHLLVVTKEHIENALKVKDASTIKEMKLIGEKVLNGMCEKLNITNRQFRFGFHLPPFNSIDHLHLHCFIEPIESFKFNRIFYGYFLNSV